MITYDRATTKLLYGLPPDSEYGRWNGTFTNGVTSWRRLVQQRITQGTLNTARILVVGCGLGLMVEGLKDEGFQRAWGINLGDYFSTLWDTPGGNTSITYPDGGVYIDPTTKIQTPIAPGGAWPCEVRADIRPLLGIFDVRTMTTTQVGTLTGLTGAQRKFDLILTEDVMTAYPVADMEAIYAHIDNTLLVNTAAQVRHLVSVGFDGTPYGGAPAMDLTQWTATLAGRTNHQFQDIAGVTA